MPRSLLPPAARRGALATVAAATFLGLSACGSNAPSTDNAAASDGGTSTDAAAAQEGGTLKLAFNQDPFGNIDPNQNFWIESRSIDRNLVDSLTDQDPKTGEIVPWLATTWTVSPDAKRYVFTLRKDVTFSDGTPLDAKAVKTAYDGIVALGAKATLGPTYLSGYKATKVLAPDRVEVDFSAPNAAFLQASSTTTLGILSPASYDKSPAKRAAGDFVGSGPFTLASYKPGQSVKLLKRKDYAWGSPINVNRKAAHIDELDVSFVPEESVLVGSLTSGQIDVAWPRNPLSEQSQQTVEASGDKVASAVLPGLTYNLIPNVHGVLGDAQVRTALRKAIDLKQWASTIFGDDYPVAKSVIDSTTPQWSDQSALLAYDEAGAAKLLDDAGWKTGSDGYRHKDGKALEVSFVISNQWAGWDLLQDQLKKVGIKLDQKVVTPADLVTKTNTGKFDLTASYVTRGDADILRTYYDQAVVKPGAGPGAYNQDPATAKALSALYAREIEEVDPAARKAIFAKIQEQSITSGALLPLQDRTQLVATSGRVHDLKLTLETFLRLNDLWLSK